jgi:hypothetical protein
MKPPSYAIFSSLFHFLHLRRKYSSHHPLLRHP